MHPEVLLRSSARSEIDTERFLDFFEKNEFARTQLSASAAKFLFVEKSEEPASARVV